MDDLCCIKISFLICDKLLKEEHVAASEATPSIDLQFKYHHYDDLTVLLQGIHRAHRDITEVEYNIILL